MSFGRLQKEIQTRKERVDALYPALLARREKTRAMSAGVLEFGDARLKEVVLNEIFLFKYYLLELSKIKKESVLEEKEIDREEKAIHEILTRLCQIGQYKADTLERRAGYALIHAAQDNDDALFDAALAVDANPNFNYLGRRVLIEAVKNKNIRMAGALIKAGADINVCGATFTQESPLICAVGRDDIAMVEFLLDKGAEVNQITDGGDKTALFEACSNNNTSLQTLELLLSRPGIKVNQTWNDRIYGPPRPCPLSAAFRNMKENHDSNKVRCLLRHGALKKEKDFCFVVRKMGVEAVSFMLAEGYVCTPEVLETAFHYANSDIIDLLVKQKDAPILPVKNTLIQDRGFTELMFAVLMGDRTEVSRLVKEEKSDVRALNDVQCSARMIAVKLARTEIVRILDHAEIARRLLKEGANVNIEANHGHTALEVATEVEKEEIALLREDKVDVTKSTERADKGLTIVISEVKPEKGFNRVIEEIVDLTEDSADEVVLSVDSEMAAREAESLKLKALFNKLHTKIGRIDNHPFAKAKEVASRLLANLEVAKNVYEESVKENPKSFQEASKIFLKSCESAIEIAKPVLERDLGWGTYFQNLLKSIANVFITTANFFGCSQTFFQKQRATSAIEVTEFHSQLKTKVFN